MFREYCTLSDRAYLAKLLAMHESLMQHSSEPFALNVLAMDRETFVILSDMELPNVIVLPLAAFENALQMDHVKKSRSRTEYFWTCASSLMQYLMAWKGVSLTYLDADLMFFSDPKVVFDEIGERSIAITPHRFPAHRKHMERNGIYNVAWVTAKNSKTGHLCISRWAAQCREWCFHKNEAGKFGDQLYLDTWPTDYPGEVCVIQNPGVNLAPWNVDGYVISADSSGPLVDGVPVVFYHFHEFEHREKLTNYKLRIAEKKHIYEPYVDAWERASLRIYAQEKVMAARQSEIETQGQRA